jgi:hypothetical protein
LRQVCEISPKNAIASISLSTANPKINRHLHKDKDIMELVDDVKDLKPKD